MRFREFSMALVPGVTYLDKSTEFERFTAMRGTPFPASNGLVRTEGTMQLTFHVCDRFVVVLPYVLGRPLYVTYDPPLMSYNHLESVARSVPVTLVLLPLFILVFGNGRKGLGFRRRWRD